MKFSSATRPETEDRVQYHIDLKPGDIPQTVLLPGDPERVARISSTWDKFEHVASHRQYITHKGTYKGVPIAATSTGIGCPATAIAIEELANIGVKNLIRVGTTGAIQKGINCGDIIISSAVVRLDGTSHQYVRSEFPAFSHYEVLLALIEAAESLGLKYHVGITASTDSFYTGQGRPGFGGYWQSWMDNIIPDLQRAGVLNFEMEASTLFTLATLFGLRAGAVTVVYANRETNEFEVTGEPDAIACANEAVKILHEMDLEKSSKNKHYWYRGLIK